MAAVTKKKKATNVSIDSELIDKARALGINLSQTLNDELRRKVKAAEEAAWLEENREAIAAYNRRIERDGLWSEGIRLFDEPV